MKDNLNLFVIIYISKKAAEILGNLQRCLNDLVLGAESHHHTGSLPTVRTIGLPLARLLSTNSL